MEKSLDLSDNEGIFSAVLSFFHFYVEYIFLHAVIAYLTPLKNKEG